MAEKYTKKCVCNKGDLLDLHLRHIFVGRPVMMMMMMMMMIGRMRRLMMVTCFCAMVDWRKAGQIWEVLTITNVWHATNRIWTCAEPEFRLCWMKLRSIDNPYTTATQFVIISHMSLFIGSLSYGSNSKTISRSIWIWHVRCWIGINMISGASTFPDVN